MNSVGQAYAILRGYRQGNAQEADRFLQSMSPAQRAARNRSESAAKGSLRKRAKKMGQGPRGRRTY